MGVRTPKDHSLQSLPSRSTVGLSSAVGHAYAGVAFLSGQRARADGRAAVARRFFFCTGMGLTADWFRPSVEVVLILPFRSIDLGPL